MPHHKDSSAFVRNREEYARLLGFRKNGQFFDLTDVLRAHLGMSGVRGHKAIVKSAHQRHFPVHHTVFIDAELFLRQKIFFQSVVIVHSRLCPPAQMQGGRHMALRPLKDLADLLPVIHVLVFHLLHRCPGDDQPVKIASLNIRKTLVEFIQMTHRRILGLMAGHRNKCHIDLKRRVRQGTQKLQFRLFFQRHQI